MNEVMKVLDGLVKKRISICDPGRQHIFRLKGFIILLEGWKKNYLFDGCCLAATRMYIFDYCFQYEIVDLYENKKATT